MPNVVGQQLPVRYRPGFHKIEVYAEHGRNNSWESPWWLRPWALLALAYYQGKDIVFRFIMEYSSLRDFGPY
jgi:hypothetical protein